MKEIPERIIIPEFIPVFQQIPWLNLNRQDYRLLSNKP